MHCQWHNDGHDITTTTTTCVMNFWGSWIHWRTRSSATTLGTNWILEASGLLQLAMRSSRHSAQTDSNWKHSDIVPYNSLQHSATTLWLFWISFPGMLGCIAIAFLARQSHRDFCQWRQVCWCLAKCAERRRWHVHPAWVWDFFGHVLIFVRPATCKDAYSSEARYVYADGSAYKGTWSADSLDGEVHPQGAEATSWFDHFNSFRLSIKLETHIFSIIFSEQVESSQTGRLHDLNVTNAEVVCTVQQ